MPKENQKTTHLADYRKLLVAAEQKSQEDFDKTVLSLSGGALGIFFVFIKEVIGPQPIVSQIFLVAAWLSWAFSTLSVLTSYYLSHLALRRAISQVDDDMIYKQPTGGVFASLTSNINPRSNKCPSSLKIASLKITVQESRHRHWWIFRYQEQSL
ncbi:MAG: hypothetical protein RI956_131 [Pseudomonadota bacterium]|jgi:hypothetical protein